MKNFLLKINKLSFIFVIISIMILACSGDDNPSIYSKREVGETPVIISLQPQSEGVAGVTEITISGENFSANRQENLVFFNDERATILENSTANLVVKAPILVNDSITIKIAVKEALLYSNSFTFKLTPPTVEIFKFLKEEDPYALTLDNEGNIYFSLIAFSVGRGIKKLSPNTLSYDDFAPKGGEDFYNGIKYGQDNLIYGVRNVRAIFQIDQGMSPSVFAVLENDIFLHDLDFDKNNTLWTAGKGGKVFSVTQDKIIHSFIFEPDVSSIRIYDDYVYLAGVSDSLNKIWRFEIISSDSLGPIEQYFDFSSNFNSNITAITFSAEGDLFIGTDRDEPIIVVYKEGTFKEWYVGLLTGPVRNFAWGLDNYLYYSRGNSDKLNPTIFKVDMERQGAPHFGRD